MTTGSYGEGVMTSGNYGEGVMTSGSYGEGVMTSRTQGEGVMTSGSCGDCAMMSGSYVGCIMTSASYGGLPSKVQVHHILEYSSQVQVRTRTCTSLITQSSYVRHIMIFIVAELSVLNHGYWM